MKRVSRYAKYNKKNDIPRVKGAHCMNFAIE